MRIRKKAGLGLDLFWPVCHENPGEVEVLVETKRFARASQFRCPGQQGPGAKSRQLREKVA